MRIAHLRMGLRGWFAMKTANRYIGTSIPHVADPLCVGGEAHRYHAVQQPEKENGYETRASPVTNPVTKHRFVF
jgi:hypothetical protein